jgi:predicted metal-dependent phosphoesterase TrpH
MKVDLHVHTCYSKDSATSLEEVIQATRQHGLDRVAITDHNRLEGALRLRDLAPETVIVGEEIRTTQGELLGFFLEEEVPADLSPEEAIAHIRQQGGIVGVSHPLDRVRREAIAEKALEGLKGQLDCLEAFNARCLRPAYNHRAARLAAEWELPVTAGSDAHHPIEIGQAYVEMPDFSGRDDFLEALGQGRVQGRLSPWWVHLCSTWAKIRRRMLRPTR